MKGILTFIVIILLLALIINFPVVMIGLAVTIFGFIVYQKKKKENVKSKLAPAALLLGIMLTLSGCVAAVAGDDTEKETTSEEEIAKKEELPAEIKEEQKQTSKSEVEKEDKEKTQETEPVKEEVIEEKSEPAEETAKPAENTSSPKESIDTSGTTAQIPVTLLKTIDGDTIKVRYDGKEMNVRYLLIDTPETSHPRLGKQPFGEEAKERNRQLINSGKLTIEFDVGERVDKYGRLLAYVYVDGESVQKTLLSEGLARVAYVYPPNTRHLTPYEEAEAYAKKNKLGIWSIENYATDSGFNGSVPSSSNSASANSSTNTTSNQQSSAGTQSNTATEWFKNCTELRKVYPNGVPKGHAAYQAKMDRDKDNYACER